jgi:hypothetical protein
LICDGILKDGSVLSAAQDETSSFI